MFKQASKVKENNGEEELVDIICSLLLQNLIPIKNLLNPIEENNAYMKLYDYKIIELIYYKEAKESKGVDNALKEDCASAFFMCMEKLHCLYVIISMLDIGDMDEYTTHKILCNI